MSSLGVQIRTREAETNHNATNWMRIVNKNQSLVHYGLQDTGGGATNIWISPWYRIATDCHNSLILKDFQLDRCQGKRNVNIFSGRNDLLHVGFTRILWPWTIAPVKTSFWDNKFSTKMEWLLSSKRKNWSTGIQTKKTAAIFHEVPNEVPLLRQLMTLMQLLRWSWDANQRKPWVWKNEHKVTGQRTRNYSKAPKLVSKTCWL